MCILLIKIENEIKKKNDIDWCIYSNEKSKTTNKRFSTKINIVINTFKK